MASSPIQINMLLNTRGVIEGARDAEGALNVLSDEVDDLLAGRDNTNLERGIDDAERAARDLTDTVRDTERAVNDLDDATQDLGRNDGAEDLEDGLSDAERAARDLEDQMRDVQKATERAGDEGDDAGRKMRDGLDKASEGAAEFKDEAASSAREAAASFDGSAESISDVFQEIAANAFAGFGPAGAVAGIAAAAGIGLAVAGFEDVNEAREESQERIKEWRNAFIEAGADVLEEQQIISRGLQIMDDDMEQVKKNQLNWGVSAGTALRAMAGDTDALAIVQQSLNDKMRDLYENWDQEKYTFEEARATMLLHNDELRDGVTAYNNITGEMKTAQDEARIWSDVLKGVIDDSAEATVQVDNLGNAVYTLPDGTQIMIDAETGLAHQNIDRFKGDLDEIPAHKAVTVKGTVSIDDTAIRYYRPPTIHVPVQPYIRGGGRILNAAV